MPFSSSSIRLNHRRGENMLANARRRSQQNTCSDVEVFLDRVQLVIFGGFVGRSAQTVPTHCTDKARARCMYAVDYLRAPDAASPQAQPHHARMFTSSVAKGGSVLLFCRPVALIPLAPGEFPYNSPFSLTSSPRSKKLSACTESPAQTAPRERFRFKTLHLHHKHAISLTTSVTSAPRFPDFGRPRQAAYTCSLGRKRAFEPTRRGGLLYVPRVVASTIL